MERAVPLMENETYHIFNRGAHKQPIFIDNSDYQRFQILLFLANTVEKVDVGNILAKYQGRSLVEVFRRGRKSLPLVDVLAYSLMPNHFHIAIRQKVPEGITTFMRKLGTGYSMYFNLKREHSGTLFQGRFKSSHVDSDPYFNWVFAYVHLNPLVLHDPEWDLRRLRDPAKAQQFLQQYPYSSYSDYFSDERPERAILAYEDGSAYMGSKKELKALLRSFGRGRVLFEMFQT